MILNHPGLAVAAVRREILATMAQMKALGEVIASMPGEVPPDKLANLVTKFRTAEADLARLVAMFGPIEDDKVVNLNLFFDKDTKVAAMGGSDGSFRLVAEPANQDDGPPPPEAA